MATYDLKPEMSAPAVCDKLVEAIDSVPFGYADTLQGQAEAEENEAYE